ncbi:MAG: hypothetical protein RLP44_25180 [Aggregatilineales bacterium]
MPIEVTWDNESSGMLRWDISNPWGIKDFQDALEKGLSMTNQSAQPRVDVLITAPKNLNVPNGLLTSLNSLNRRNVLATETGDSGLVVMCTENNITKALIQLVSRLSRNSKWLTAPSLDTGRELILVDRQKA